MGNWSLYGIILIVGIFFVLTGVLMALVNVANPLTGQETSVWGWFWSAITPW